MRLRLVPTSTNLWAEFTAFQRLTKWQLTKEIDRVRGPDQLCGWLMDEMKSIMHMAQTLVTHHSFPYPPPLEWLTHYTPQMNQATLLATASPPVVADMSTVMENQYRSPPQWAVFIQYNMNLSVTMKPLPIPHPLMDRSVEEY